jgi:glycerate 2-kinase
MNILVAPNSMKGNLSCFDFADIVEEAFFTVSHDFIIRKVPVADGGDMTGAVLSKAMDAKEIEVEVNDPLGRPVLSKYSISKRTAIIEMAEASGLKLLKHNELNPMIASTYGTGQLIADALGKGCLEILLGVGGSATVDGGSGMLEALGFHLFNNEGQRLHGNGKNTAQIKRIEKSSYLKDFSAKIICDVDNPLTGTDGAAMVFGPQKGASPEMVEYLEKGLTNWSSVLEQYSGKRLAELKGAGAAGGIALPMIAFLNAEIVPGSDFILSLLNFDEEVKWADLVITGEGKIDSQTLNKKAPKAVADAAHKRNKPVIALGGTVNYEASGDFNGIFSITDRPMSLQMAMDDSRKLLYNFAYELAKFISGIKKYEQQKQ